MDPQCIFQMPHVPKMAKLFMGGIPPVHYVIVFWGFKKTRTEKDWGEDKQVVTNVTLVPQGPSHLKHVPVREGLLKRAPREGGNIVYKLTSLHFIKCPTSVHFKDEPFTSLCRLPPWLTGRKCCSKTQDGENGVAVGEMDFRFLLLFCYSTIQFITMSTYNFLKTPHANCRKKFSFLEAGSEK